MRHDDQSRDDQAANIRRYEARCQQKWKLGKDTSGRVFHLASEPVDWDAMPDDQADCLRMRDERIRAEKRREDAARQYRNPQYVGVEIENLKKEIEAMRQLVTQRLGALEAKLNARSSSRRAAPEIDHSRNDILVRRVSDLEYTVNDLATRADLHRKAIKSMIDSTRIKKTA